MKCDHLISMKSICQANHFKWKLIGLILGDEYENCMSAIHMPPSNEDGDVIIEVWALIRPLKQWRRSRLLQCSQAHEVDFQCWIPRTSCLRLNCRPVLLTSQLALKSLYVVLPTSELTQHYRQRCSRKNDHLLSPVSTLISKMVINHVDNNLVLFRSRMSWR